MDSFSIRSGQGLYTVRSVESAEILTSSLIDSPQSVVVIDDIVAGLYEGQLEPLFSRLPVLRIAATENEKTLSGVTRVLDFFQASNATRQTSVVALGGGIIQDIVAFASHVYYRGLSWRFAPTTLLAMADSCIGAKCGINFNTYKNQLGAFHSPSAVVIWPGFLRTLSDDYLLSGYGEILKLALTESEQFYEKLKRVLRENGSRGSEVKDLILKSLAVKKEFIEQDEYDTGVRNLLNYGHTFGHALEKATHHAVPHGIAVAIGLDLANFVALRKGLLQERWFDEIHGLVERYFSFTSRVQIIGKELIDGIARDKKVRDGRINLILLERPGKLCILPTAFDDLLNEAVNSYLSFSRVFQ